MTVAEPGWYPDPERPDEARYWDGSTWTGARRAIDAATEPVEGPRLSRDRRATVLVIGALALVASIGGFVVGSFVLDDDDGGSEPAATKQNVPRRSSSTASSTTTRPPATTTTTIGPQVPAPELSVPFDLGIPGHPMSAPACDGSYIVHLAAATTPGGYVSAISNLLTRYPGSSYLRTNATCSSLRPSDNDGDPIYSVFYGPYATLPEACAALSRAPGAYVRILDVVTAPGTSQGC